MAREKLALAADIPLPEAEALYARVSAHVGVLKIGLSLFVEHGPRAVEPFLRAGAQVFLDLKLHDIPNTVELAARQAGALGVSYLTVHAQGGSAMLKAAVAGANDGAASRGFAAPKILAVTVLTSLEKADLVRMGHTLPLEVLAGKLAGVAMEAGVGGLVCSARELKALRAQLGPQAFLCSPGIRPAGAEAMDQSRVETPAFAIESGADLLVVGRPIYTAADSVSAVAQIQNEMTAALKRR